MLFMRLDEVAKKNRNSPGAAAFKDLVWLGSSHQRHEVFQSEMDASCFQPLSQRPIDAYGDFRPIEVAFRTMALSAVKSLVHLRAST